MTYRQVIVGSDGSETSLIAVRRGATLAAGIGATLRVICAYHPVAGRDQALVPERVAAIKGRMTGQSAAQRALEQSLDVANEAAVEAVGELRRGDAVDALLEASQDEPDSLLVVGSRGMHRLSGRLLGAVPSDLSHRAERDVLIVQTSEAIPH